MMESFVQHLHTNYVPSEPEIKLIHSHLASHETELARLESLIRDLSAQRDQIKAYIDPYRALASQGRRIPQELLEHIFLDCLPEHRNAAMSSAEAPLLLGHICSAWRSIAFALPQLWAAIHVSSKFMSDVPISELQTWLARSASSPIAFSLQCASGETEKALPALIDVSARWKRVQIHGSSLQELESTAVLRVAAPWLQDITIIFREDPVDWDITRDPTRVLVLSLFQGPSLQSVTIHTTHPIGFVPREPFLWNQLLHLTLSFPMMSDDPRIQTNHGDFTIDSALLLMKYCPRLESIHMHLYWPHAPSYQETIFLPHLKSLTILDRSLISAQDLSYFLDHLNMPALSHLHLPSVCPQSYPDAFQPSVFSALTDRSPLVTSLRLPLPFFDQQSFAEILDCFPSLVVLRTIDDNHSPRGGEAPVDTAHLLHLLSHRPPSHTAEILCPALKELVLEQEALHGDTFWVSVHEAILGRQPLFERLEIRVRYQYQEEHGTPHFDALHALGVQVGVGYRFPKGSPWNGVER
ncbi:hypothetical protein FB45DRAFT_910697 [Roridomyces roridus]|uniref:F-box domain-containing protein n=1 Tax=Roridomyces roridus TaxID=1738132 RepID=A0AAD7BZY3_9AGAR|nr:hypothetical protein FB45DRAFT_910697 [Roridomyces roridus]